MKKILLLIALISLAYLCSFFFINNFLYKDTQEVLSTIIAFLPVLLAATFILSYLLIQKSNFNDLLLEQKNHAKLKLSQTRELFNNVIKESAIAMAVLNTNGKIIKFNNLFLNLFELKTENLMQLNFHDLLIIGGVKHYKLIIDKFKNNIINVSQQKEEWRKESGEMIFIDIKLSLVYDRFNEPIYIIVSMANLTEKRQIESQLNRISHYDALTGVVNSNGMYKLASQLTAESYIKQKFIVMAANVDNFKNVIGSLGYDAGDALLKTVAERMQKSVKQGDLVARISGDLFVLIIGNVTDTTMQQAVINKVIEAIMQPVKIGEQEIIVTLSVGVSVYPNDGKDIKTLLKNADIALQRAKLAGKNNYQFYSHELTAIMDTDLALRSALSGALIHNEFILHYQPKIDLISLNITGVEAFLRWKNTQFSNVPSGEIIKVAIDTGLIIAVGDWVLRTACEQIKVWQKIGLVNVSIAINCSLREIYQRNYIDKIMAICKESDIPPHLLEIEFKESDIMRDTKLICEILFRLKNNGITVVIDDYGRGQCSLTNLKRLSLDKIKISTVLINQIQIDDLSTSITTAIINSANKMGVKTIATQVENKNQYDYLSSIGCKEVQGRYILEPSSNLEVTSYILKAKLHQRTQEERSQT